MPSCFHCCNSHEVAFSCGCTRQLPVRHACFSFCCNVAAQSAEITHHALVSWRAQTLQALYMLFTHGFSLCFANLHSLGNFVEQFLLLLRQLPQFLSTAVGATEAVGVTAVETALQNFQDCEGLQKKVTTTVAITLPGILATVAQLSQILHRNMSDATGSANVHSTLVEHCRFFLHGYFSL